MPRKALFDAADHVHAGMFGVTLTAAAPPALGDDAAVADSVYEQVPASWETVKVCPAIVIVPLRGDSVFVAATE
jgi:hypothetical protein